MVMSAQQFQFIVDGSLRREAWTASSIRQTSCRGTYAWGVNIVNRGGIVQTRPGRHRVISFSGRLAQGAHWCRTVDDHNYILVAIDGFVYWAAFPFLTWTKAANIAMNPQATLESGLRRASGARSSTTPTIPLRFCRTRSTS